MQPYLIDQLDMLGDQRLGDVEDVAHELAHVDALVLDDQLALLHLGGVEDVVDELEQPPPGRFDDADGLDGLRGGFTQLCEHNVDELNQLLSRGLIDADGLDGLRWVGGGH